MTPMLQNVLVLALVLGFGGMEFASRRHQATVHANANAAAATP